MKEKMLEVRENELGESHSFFLLSFFWQPNAKDRQNASIVHSSSLSLSLVFSPLAVGLTLKRLFLPLRRFRFLTGSWWQFGNRSQALASIMQHNGSRHYDSLDLYRRTTNCAMNLPLRAGRECLLMSGVFLCPI